MQKLHTEESFFNNTTNENNDDEEDNSYEPIVPMKEVKKYGVEQIDSSSIEVNNEDKGVKNNNNKVKTNTTITNKGNSPTIKSDDEKKLKKIEKILKANIRNFSKPRVEQEDDDQGPDHNETIERPRPFSMNYLTNIKPINNKTISYNQYSEYDKGSRIYQKTITSNRKREDGHDSNVNTYSNINQRRTLTPLKQTHINYTATNKNNRNVDGNDSEYQKLENQLRDMEEHLKSMNADSTITYEKNLIHSKSSGYLHKDPYTISIQGMLSNNPFIPSPSELNNHPLASNPINELDAYLIDDKTSNAINLPLQSETRTLTYNTIHLPNIHSIPLSQQTNRFHPNVNILYDNNLDHGNEHTIDNNNDKASNSKMNQIETKINSLESEIHDMKLNFDKLASNIQLLIKDNSSNSNISNMPLQNQHQLKQNSINDQMVSVILTECAKMIDAKFCEYRSNNTSIIEANNNNLGLSHKTNSVGCNSDNYHMGDSDMLSFESRLNKKIEEKFDSLANNIQTQIYDKFLKPSINTIENTMRTNLEEIKLKVNSLNEQNNDSGSFIDSYHSKSLQSSILSIGKSTQRRNDKIEEINAIGERLYDKLVEKEKKLNDLKKETTNYLKKKIKND